MPITAADKVLDGQLRESWPRTIRRLCQDRACHTGSPDLIAEPSRSNPGHDRRDPFRKFEFTVNVDRGRLADAPDAP